MKLIRFEGEQAFVESVSVLSKSACRRFDRIELDGQDLYQLCQLRPETLREWTHTWRLCFPPPRCGDPDPRPEMQSQDPQRNEYRAGILRNGRWLVILRDDVKSTVTQYRDAVRFKLALDLKALNLPGAALLISVSTALYMESGAVELKSHVRDTQREYYIADTLSIDWLDTDRDINGKYPAFWSRIKARILAEYPSNADLVHPFAD